MRFDALKRSYAAPCVSAAFLSFFLFFSAACAQTNPSPSGAQQWADPGAIERAKNKATTEGRNNSSAPTTQRPVEAGSVPSPPSRPQTMTTRDKSSPLTKRNVNSARGTKPVVLRDRIRPTVNFVHPETAQGDKAAKKSKPFFKQIEASQNKNGKIPRRNSVQHEKTQVAGSTRQASRSTQPAKPAQTQANPVRHAVVRSKSPEYGLDRTVAKKTVSPVTGRRLVAGQKELPVVLQGHTKLKMQAQSTRKSGSAGKIGGSYNADSKNSTEKRIAERGHPKRMASARLPVASMNAEHPADYRARKLHRLITTQQLSHSDNRLASRRANQSHATSNPEIDRPNNASLARHDPANVTLPLHPSMKRNLKQQKLRASASIRTDASTGQMRNTRGQNIQGSRQSTRNPLHPAKIVGSQAASSSRASLNSARNSSQ